MLTMEEAKFWVGTIAPILGALLVAYVVVRVAIAELKKDNLHLNEKVNAEIVHKEKRETEHSTDMKEVRNKIDGIYKFLNEIKVELAHMQGRDDVLTVVKDAMVTISKKGK